MGGQKRKRGNIFAQKKRNKKENKRPVTEASKPYVDIVKENESFIKYYKSAGICPDEEWDTFLSFIKQDLPTSFRVTGNISEANALLKLIKSQLFMEELKGDGDRLPVKPFCLPWYPNGLAWQLQLTRKDIRRSEAYFKLHNFLISETDAGSISRQEVVSMIPPIVLDVQPHHKVLDMCAAPGSKTAQLIESLHKTNGSGELPKGFVIANDVDNNRCYMLVHQAKRLNSPNILITNHDSSLFPNLKVQDNGIDKKLKFDRILCDVPCSGDGTLRKNPDIWLKWSAANGANLHGIQFRILRRGVELLEIGGRLVYSTCSLNPMENESVVHRILSEANDSLRLLPASELVPGLKYYPGMSKWRPASKDLVFYNTFEEVPEKWQTCIRPQMFPPKPEDADKYCLDKCLRILPHLQDTGGFFVALFEKVSNMPWEASESVNQENKVKSEESLENSTVSTTSINQEDKIKSEDSLENGNVPATESSTTKEEKSVPWGPQRKKNRIGGYKEDPFVFFKENEDVWQSIKEFYFLNDQFDPTCLLTRCLVGKKKNIYFCSPGVKDLVLRNECRIKIINTGVKTFVRCDNKNMKCPFRLAQEGLGSLFPFIGDERKFTLLKEDLVALLQCDDPTRPPEIESLSEHIQNQVKDLSGGSCVLTYTNEEFSLKMVGWRGTKSLRAYTAREDTIHMLRILGADISKFDINKFKKTETNESSTIEETNSTHEPCESTSHLEENES